MRARCAGHRGSGTATLYVTHDTTEAMTMGDGWVLRDGYCSRPGAPGNSTTSQPTYVRGHVHGFAVIEMYGGGTGGTGRGGFCGGTRHWVTSGYPCWGARRYQSGQRTGRVPRRTVIAGSARRAGRPGKPAARPRGMAPEPGGSLTSKSSWSGYSQRAARPLPPDAPRVREEASSGS